MEDHCRYCMTPLDPTTDCGCGCDGERMAQLEAQLAEKWISVDERLPDERVLVLVSGFEGQVGVAHYAKGVWYTPEPQIVCGTDVTHWMPIPNPPQTGEE